MAKIRFSLIKKIKIGRPEYLLTPHPRVSDNISFLPYSHPPNSLKKDVICVSPLSFHFVVETRNGNLNIEKEQEKHLNLITVHFKIWSFNSEGSPVNDDKKITFESDKKCLLLSEMYGKIFLKYNI